MATPSHELTPRPPRLPAAGLWLVVAAAAGSVLRPSINVLPLFRVALIVQLIVTVMLALVILGLYVMRLPVILHRMPPGLPVHIMGIALSYVLLCASALGIEFEALASNQALHWYAVPILLPATVVGFVALWAMFSLQWVAYQREKPDRDALWMRNQPGQPGAVMDDLQDKPPPDPPLPPS
jgi:hypothetical protein